MIEGEGGGIREAKEALREAGMPEPRFVDTGVSFTVVMYRQNANTVTTNVREAAQATLMPTTANESIILAGVSSGETSVPELIRRSGLSRRQVKYALSGLISSGRVIMIGGRGNRFTTYREVL